MNSITGMGSMSPYTMIDQMTQSMIKSKDKNSDNVLTFDEFGGTQDVFNSIDANSDGKLDVVELNKAGLSKILDQQTSALISSLDTNGDGALSADELKLSADVFNTIDTNSDGMASLAELNAAFIAKQATAQYQTTMNSANSTNSTNATNSTNSTASSGSSSSIIV